MNKRLFWTGLSMQSLHLFLLMIAGLSLITWNLKVLLGVVYVIFNIASLVFILVGAVIEEKPKNSEVLEKTEGNKKKKSK